LSTTALVLDDVLEVSVVGSFTKLGYDTRRRLFHWAPPSSLSGKSVLITGATSGLGLESAITMARLGASVQFVARDEGRARAAREKILLSSTSGEVEYFLADMSDLESVRDVAEQVQARSARLDVLVHNAGAIAPTRSVAKNGVEVTVAAQLLGPFMLTQLLLPSLRAAAPGKVVTVSSGGMYSQRFDLQRLINGVEPYDGVATYARVKRALVVVTHEWANRVDASEVVFASMHPGWVDTPGVRTSLPRFYRVMGPLLRTTAQGADTIIWLASDADLASDDGKFWLDRRVRPEYKVPRTRPADARADQVELWEWCVGHTEPAAPTTP
jgi:NAD(P)-dependent dehydrogenase (short-subunit alcohol dehydrogenase family)